MTATSRVPRPRVADEKNPSRKRRVPDLTASELANCRALQSAWVRANAGKKGRRRISDGDLAEAGAKYGGASHRQQWYRYRQGHEAIPPINQMVAAIVLNCQPQDIFPDFRDDVLRLIRNTIDLLQVEMSDADRSALMYIIQRWCDAKRVERDKLSRFARSQEDPGALARKA